LSRIDSLLVLLELAERLTERANIERLTSLSDLVAHEFVLDRSGVRRKRTLSVIRNPVIRLYFIHWNAQLGVWLDQLMDQISTFYNKRSFRYTIGHMRRNRKKMSVLLLAQLMGQYCFARWRLSSVVVCNAAGGQTGRLSGA